MEELKLGIYRHCKGGDYEVIGVARHSETLDEFVVYRSLEEKGGYPKGTIWVRPKEMFMSDKEIDGNVVRRFEFVK